MSLLDEYGLIKFNQGFKQCFDQGKEISIVKFLKTGIEPEIVAQKSEVPLGRILEIKEEYNI